MIPLSSIINTFEAEFLARYGNALLPGQRQALAAMKQCRTALSPRLQAQCTACDAQRFIPHSCGHRACPHCQHHESQQWLQRQINKLVPGDYFLLTFTLPAELRGLAWRHQRTLYDLMMRCSWATLRTFSRNDRQLRGTPGAIAVLHTHSRRLDYHPHVHLVMPAAAIDAGTRLWRTKTCPRNAPYLFSHKALAKVFRARMLEALAQAGLALPASHPEKWVVDCQHVGSGEKALVYLGRYLWRDPGAEHPRLPQRPGDLPLPTQQNPPQADPNAPGRRFPAPAATPCPAQGSAAGAQLRLPPPQQQAADPTAAPPVPDQPRARRRRDPPASGARLSRLRRRDADRANADHADTPRE